jgi:DNA-binding beta-propeller fold protein YncE
VRLSGKIFVMTLAALQTAGAVEPQPQASAPVSLVHRFTLPGTLRGHFDHFTVDPVGKRLFGTAVEDQRVVVFDFEQGRVLKEIQGVHKPRAVLYRPDLTRLYVSDGGGALRVFDSNTFAPLKSFKICVDADPIAYDAATQRLLVVNGGEKAHHTAIDTRKSPFES